MITTIFIADDHKVVRQGIKALLEFEPDFRVIGEAGDGFEALSLMEPDPPDILLTDISMPNCSGIELAQEIVNRRWRTRVVVLSMHDSQPCVDTAIARGALGYVLKELGTEHLVVAIREVLLGHRYVSPPLVMSVE